MRVTLSKRFDFDAAHRLPKMPEGHKCRRPHGHTYVVEIICSGQVDDETGLLVDYAMLALAWLPIHAQLDHRDLNEIPGLENPTTEVLAHWILRKLVRGGVMLPLERVRVYESSTTYCEAAL